MLATKSPSVWNQTRTACHRRETSLGLMVGRLAQHLRTWQASGAAASHLRTVVQKATTPLLGLEEGVRNAAVAGRAKRSLKASKLLVTRADRQCSPLGPQRPDPQCHHLDLQCLLLAHHWRLTSHTSCLRGQRWRLHCRNQGLPFCPPASQRPLWAPALGPALDLVLALCKPMRHKGGSGPVNHAK